MERRLVQSREYKVMLRPQRFGGGEAAMVQAAGEFFRAFCANAVNVVADADGELGTIKNRRLITFFDTSKQLLNGSGYIFRERVDLKSPKREVTLKFRHADRFVAQDRSMDPSGAATAKTKFEEDIKSPFLSLYSFSTTVPAETTSPGLGDLGQLFPDLAQKVTGFDTSETLAAVNGFTARELVVEGGSIKFSKQPKVEADCALIVWYDQAGPTDGPVAAEFSFRYGDETEAYGGAAALVAFDTFSGLQQLTDWIDPNGPTKTAFAFR